MPEAVLQSPRAAQVTLPRVPFGTDASRVASLLAQAGGVVLVGLLTGDQVAAVNADLSPHMDGTGQGNFSDGEGNFIGDFMGMKTKRLVHCVRWSKTYREAVIGSEQLAAYVAALVPGSLGKHSLGSSQAIEIYPGEKAQVLHRDASTMLQLLGLYQPQGPEILINSLLALTDVTEEMGATRVIPGSHAWDDFERPGLAEETVPALLNAGDMLLFSGRLLHGGGANVTPDRPRRVVSQAFSIPFFMGEEAWPFVIPLEEARDYPIQVQSMLGFRSVSFQGEEPGFLWRMNTRPLEEVLAL